MSVGSEVAMAEIVRETLQVLLERLVGDYWWAQYGVS